MSEHSDPDLADCLDRFYVPKGSVPIPPVKFRPAMEELDVELLEQELGAGMVAHLRDCYRRLGA